ncbi:MAG: ParB/RepB/Spo0J family partition protein [Acidimicrobiales bacterium]
MAVGDVSTFGRAWRKKTRRRVAASVGLGGDTQELLPLDEVTRRLRLFEQSYRGVRPIPVSSIVGTVDRSGDFDREFLPRRSAMEQRWNRVEHVVDEGEVPPIVVYELEGRYFLVDGHHRVAIARQRGIEYLDAEVTSIRTRYPLPAGADIAQVIHSQAEHVFLEESGLAQARPGARITTRSPAGYVELLEQVKVHGYDLTRQLGRVLAPEEVAAHWYDKVYRPTLDTIRTHGLPDLFEEATEGDLFLAIQRRMRLTYFEREGASVDETVKMAMDEITPKRKGSEALKAFGDLALPKPAPRSSPKG